MQHGGNLYADLSPYYDLFCAEVNYAEQCDFAQRVFHCFVASGGRDYLDLACGTGQHLTYMALSGFAPNGLDNSAQMLAQAALRCPFAALVLSDMAELDVHERFDLVTCFLYSIHYSHPVSSLQQTLQRVWQALKPGGLFLFNSVDAEGARTHSTIITHVTDKDVVMSFQSGWHYRGEGEVLDLHLAITRESAQGIEHWIDHHTMTAISLPYLRQMLEQIGFEVTMLEHDYQSMQSWNGGSFNAIVVAVKTRDDSL